MAAPSQQRTHRMQQTAAHPVTGHTPRTLGPALLSTRGTAPLSTPGAGFHARLSGTVWLRKAPQNTIRAMRQVCASTSRIQSASEASACSSPRYPTPAGLFRARSSSRSPRRRRPRGYTSCTSAHSTARSSSIASNGSARTRAHADDEPALALAPHGLQRVQPRVDQPHVPDLLAREVPRRGQHVLVGGAAARGVGHEERVRCVVTRVNRPASQTRRARRPSCAA